MGERSEHSCWDDEPALVDRVRDGDRAAFALLVHRHMREAFSVAFRIMGQRQDAEDLVQDAFLIALRRVDTVRPGHPFAPWFFRILVNRGMNARRDRARRFTAAIPEQAAAPTAPPSAAVERHELRDRVRAVLDGLPERERIVIELADLEGFTSREIGEILGIPAGTVRWELHRARGELRTALADLQEIEHETTTQPLP
jgi:RNA polymerase sigma-70 factor, ECF subfamily